MNTTPCCKIHKNQKVSESFNRSNSKVDRFISKMTLFLYGDSDFMVSKQFTLSGIPRYIHFSQDAVISVELATSNTELERKVISMPLRRQISLNYRQLLN